MASNLDGVLHGSGARIPVRRRPRSPHRRVSHRLRRQPRSPQPGAGCHPSGCSIRAVRPTRYRGIPMARGARYHFPARVAERRVGRPALAITPTHQSPPRGPRMRCWRLAHGGVVQASYRGRITRVPPGHSAREPARDCLLQAYGLCVSWRATACSRDAHPNGRPPPPPVHGAQNVRRLLRKHRGAERTSLSCPTFRARPVAGQRPRSKAAGGEAGGWAGLCPDRDPPS